MGTTSEKAKESWSNPEIRQKRIDAMRAARRNKSAQTDQPQTQQ